MTLEEIKELFSDIWKDASIELTVAILILVLLTGLFVHHIYEGRVNAEMCKANYGSSSEYIRSGRWPLTLHLCTDGDELKRLETGE